jgi:hypothetical protein
VIHIEKACCDGKEHDTCSFIAMRVVMGKNTTHVKHYWPGVGGANGPMLWPCKTHNGSILGRVWDHIWTRMDPKWDPKLVAPKRLHINKQTSDLKLRKYGFGCNFVRVPRALPETRSDMHFHKGVVHVCPHGHMGPYSNYPV